MRQPGEENECHHPANALLPWYVKGTLQQAEVEWVRSHVESCRLCTRELVVLGEEASAGPLRALPPPGGVEQGRWATWMPYVLVVALAAPALLGARWLSLGLPGIAGRAPLRLRPSTYLDLGGGPSRAVEPLERLVMPAGVESVVISLLPPITGEAHLAFDLEGPRGSALVDERAIPGLDEDGRCSFSFPASLFESPGSYAIVVREETSLGEVRLYPFPFEVGPGG